MAFPRVHSSEEVTEPSPAPQAPPVTGFPEATTVRVETKSQTKACQTAFEQRSSPTPRERAPAPQAQRQLSPVTEKSQKRILTVPRYVVRRGIRRHVE